MPPYIFNAQQVANKFQQGVLYFETLYQAGQVPPCSPGYLSGACADGHLVAKAVTCGREQCPDCGRDGSPVHRQRFNRWQPKVQQIDDLAYLVVTIPEELRGVMKSKKNLSHFRTSLKNKLQRMGYSRGLMRWHLFGDCESCQGNGCPVCQQTGAGSVYKPHLNILINSGYIPNLSSSTFDLQLRRYLARYFLVQYGMECAINYHYQYLPPGEPENKVHAVKYITRSTFRIPDTWLQQRLHNFRSTTTWGCWQQTPESTESKQERACARCATNGKAGEFTFTNLRKYSTLTEKILPSKDGKFYILPPGPVADTVGRKIQKRAAGRLAKIIRPTGAATAKHPRTTLYSGSRPTRAPQLSPADH